MKRISINQPVLFSLLTCPFRWIASKAVIFISAEESSQVMPPFFFFQERKAHFHHLKIFSMWVWFSFLVGVRHYNEVFFRIQEGFPEGWDWFTWAFLVGNSWMLETIWRPQVPASSRCGVTVLRCDVKLEKRWFRTGDAADLAESTRNHTGHLGGLRQMCKKKAKAKFENNSVKL